MARKSFIDYLKKALFVLTQILKGLFLFFLVPLYCFKKEEEKTEKENAK